ncbi:MAG: hypothetical protein ACLR9L_04250 [Lachnospirales bacterium]
MIIGTTALLIWQKDNITAVVEATKYSDEDIQQQISDSKKTVESELEQYDIKGLRDFTFEEEEAIRKGQMTVDDAVSKILSESNVSTDNSQNSALASSNTSGNSDMQNKKSDSSSIISDYAVKLYTLKAKYLGEIGNLIDQAKADIKNGASAKDLMSTYLSKAASLENEADSKVDGLLSELRSKLEAMGADTSVVDTMKSSYESEKTLKKSYYISLYNNKK